ncbi:MAG: AMP-binding protein [Deltaproteobacteria bacterium]|nr:AMP-binding protein [Deltaproteobacteria bacterium]
MVSGGAPSPRRSPNFFLALDILILEGYGMTELSAPSTINTPGGCKIGTVGRPLPGVDVRIADDGEILVRAPSVFDGYHKLPDLTAETVVDGWMHTGDIGAFDEDGFLKITDRKKTSSSRPAEKHRAAEPGKPA